jgi:hypothetical protein
MYIYGAQMLWRFTENEKNLVFFNCDSHLFDCFITIQATASSMGNRHARVFWKKRFEGRGSRGGAEAQRAQRRE